jgi:hypothetical protein
VTRVFLDTNVYDRLRDDLATRTRLATAISRGQVRVVATPVMADEMLVGPFGGFPDYFPVQVEPEAVFVLGHARLGMARLGLGKVFNAHKGSSQNTKDAIVAESADKLADILVSEDRRCRNRLAQLSHSCTAMDFHAFCDWLSAQAIRDSV